LDISALSTPLMLERAMLLLAYIANAYVFCDADGSGKSSGAVQSLPACIAVPWYQVSKQLGRPMSLSLASVTQNWRLLDETKPVDLENVVGLVNFYELVDEDWFFLVGTIVESKGQIIHNIVQAQQAVDVDDIKRVTESLLELSENLAEINVILRRMREKCNPAIFYNKLRRFLAGYCSLPNGLVFEGVEELNGEGQKYVGTSAAQTPLLQIIDAGLQIKHTQPLLLEMRKYMQTKQVKFIEEVEKNSTIRNYVENNHSDNNAELVGAVNLCVERVAQFRSYHIQLATSYILSQAKSSVQGSGGSSFIPFLKANRDATLSYNFKPPQ